MNNEIEVGKIYRFTYRDYDTVTGKVVGILEGKIEVEYIGFSTCSKDRKLFWSNIGKVGEVISLDISDIIKTEELVQEKRISGKDSCKYFGRADIPEDEVDCYNCDDRGECYDKVSGMNEEIE